MFVPFNEMPGEAKVWAYQMNREITTPEQEVLAAAMKNFCEQWRAHGAPLRASFDIVHGHFLILAVDESASEASGCSIDGSMRVLKELGQQMGVDFFDRSQVAFLIDGRVKPYPVSALKGLFGNGTLNASLVTFNNLVGTKAEYLRHWKVEVSGSWLAKYLPKSTVA